MTHADHDHRGEYADPRHDHDGDYAEQHHRHDNRYAFDGHDHDTGHDHRGEYAEADHGHPDQYVTREAVAAMLAAFRVDMRAHFDGQAAELERIKAGIVERLEALRDRVSDLEAIVSPPLPAGQNRFDAVERKIQLVDQTVSNLISPDLVTLEGRLGLMAGEVSALQQKHAADIPHLADRIKRLEAALDAEEGQADDDQADVPPNICPGGC